MSDLNQLTDKQRAAIRFGRQADWIITAVIMLVALIFIYLLQSLPQRATFFPWFITISIMLVGVVYAISKLRNPSIWDEQYNPLLGEQQTEPDTGPAYLVPYRRGILTAIAVFLALVLASIAIGPKFAVPIFVTLALWFNGENRILAVVSGIAFWLIVHFVFGQAMSINLPIGMLQEI